MTANADRQRRYRARQRAGLNVYAVEVDFDMLDAMVEAGLVRAADANDPRAVASGVMAALKAWKDSVTRNASKRLVSPMLHSYSKKR